MREAQLNGKLRLAPDELRVDALVRTARRNLGLKCGSCSSSSVSRVTAISGSELGTALERVSSLLLPLQAEARGEERDELATPPPLRPRQPGYADWQWTSLLAR